MHCPMTKAEIHDTAERIRGYVARQKSLTTGGEWPSDMGGSGFLDALGIVASPKAGELVRAFNGVAYACIRLNALAVPTVPFKLFATTSAGEPRAKCPTRPASEKQVKRLLGVEQFRSRVQKAVIVDEVAESPILDLLYSMDLQLLIEFLDTVGQHMLWPRVAEGGMFDGVPMRLDVIPGHQVSPVTGKTFDEQLLGWKYGQKTFGVEELIWIRWPSLSAPATGCYSPLQAAWAQVMLGDKAAGRLHNALDLAPNVAVLVSPKANPNAMVMTGEGMGEGAMARLKAEFRKGYFFRREGGVMVAGEAVDVNNLGIDARALELAAQRGISREEVCACFNVPPAMLTTSTTLDNLKAAKWQHAFYGIKPRLRLIENAVNDQLIPRFDDSGRLFLAFDECVPADDMTDMARETADSNNGTRTINEIRADRNLDPVPWGEEPWLASGRRQPSEERQSFGLGSFGQPPGAPGAGAPQEKPAGEPPADDAASDSGQAAKAPPRPPEAAPSPEKEPCPHCKAATGIPAEGDAGNPAVNIHGLPDGRALAGALRPVARRLRKAVLNAAQQAFESPAKHAKDAKAGVGDLPGIDWAEWDEAFAKAAAPVLQIYAEPAARQAIARLGATDEEAAWRVQLPQVSDAAERIARDFATKANQTTREHIEGVLADVRREVADQTLTGENTLRAIEKRLGARFDELDRERIPMIAQTEASRVVHAGQLIAAEQSGMVRGVQWLGHPGMCAACAEMVAMGEVELGDAFADDGKGSPYSAVAAPPLHPNCLCSMTEVLKPLAELLADPDQLGAGYKMASWHAAAKACRVGRIRS